MQAVIPAAGEGTRLEELTNEQPKVLVEVAGKPLMQYAFETVIDVGAEELVVIIGYRGEQVIEHFGDSFDGVPITYVHQRKREGLAHAISLAKPHVDGQFIVQNGDNIIRSDLERVVEAATEHAGALLVEGVTQEEASRTGVVTTEDGLVTGVVEKPVDPPSTIATTGFFVLPEVAFHACALVRPGETGERELSHAIDLLASAGHSIVPVPVDGWRANVNTQEDINRVEQLIDAE